MTGSALLSYREVLNWIAFGEAVDDDLVDPTAGEICDDDLLPALLALAAGRAIDSPPDLVEKRARWEADEENSESLWRWYHEAQAAHDQVVAHASTLVANGGRSPEVLIAEVQARLNERAERGRRFATAVDGLVAAIGRGAICCRPVPDAGSYRGRASPDDRLRRFGALPPGWFEPEVVRRVWPSSGPFARLQQRQSGQSHVRSNLAAALPVGNLFPARTGFTADDPLLDAREAASECGRKLSTFRRDVRAGKLPAAIYVLRRTPRWRRSELRAAVELSRRT